MASPPSGGTWQCFSAYLSDLLLELIYGLSSFLNNLLTNDGSHFACICGVVCVEMREASTEICSCWGRRQEMISSVMKAEDDR
jgi:hypothetical protein